MAEKIPRDQGRGADGERHEERHSPIHDILNRVERICRIREGDAVDVERIRARHRSDDYLNVTRKQGPFVREHALYAVDILTENELEYFVLIHEKYRRRDPGCISELIYSGNPASDAFEERAKSVGIHLRSFVEYEGMIDFRRFLERQTNELQSDPIYNYSLYVDQKMQFNVGGQTRTVNNAFEKIREWLLERHSHFLLVLGDFGTGKTFLLREIARRLGQEDGPVTPIFIELRELEKAHSLVELATAHFARTGLERIDFEAFRFMLNEGRIVLLFDGFDELALRVSYSRATEHFDALMEAAGGNAKIVISTRTQHFESDNQIAQKIARVNGHRIVHLQPFDRDQIRSFLVYHLQDEDAAERRFQLIDRIKDLMGLSEVPRMLGFIASLPEKDLLEAERRVGKIKAADLYEILLNRWIGHEARRLRPKGSTPTLDEDQRWEAVDCLAVRLWQRTERFVGVRDLEQEAGTLDALAESTIHPATAAQQIGSGTLLVRDAHGAFSFVHQSILEWLVARRAVTQIQEGGETHLLGIQVMSPLMAEFFRDLLTPEKALEWLKGALTNDNEVVKQNALVVRDRLLAVGKRLGRPLHLTGRDLRGQNYAGQDLDLSNFSRSNLSSAKMTGTSLRKASLRRAQLIATDLRNADLTGADLRDADASGANLMGADLTDALLEGTVFQNSNLIATQGLTKKTLESIPVGAALPGAPILVTLRKSGTPCSSVALASRLSILASGHDDGVIRIVEPRTGREIRQLKGHFRPVNGLCFSPNEDCLASAADDGTIRLWSVTDFEEIAVLDVRNYRVHSVCFSPDGERLVSSSSDRCLRLWSVANTRETAMFEGHQNWVRSACFSPCGEFLASGADDHSVRLWSVASTQETTKLEGHCGRVQSVCFSPDGDCLASGADDKSVRLWDLVNTREIAKLEGHGGAVNSVCFSPDGECLASGSSDRRIRLWSVTKAHEVAKLEGHQGAVRSVCFSSDGKQLASGADDGSVRLWDVKSEICLAVLLRADKGWIAFTPDGRYKIAGEAGGTFQYAVGLCRFEPGELDPYWHHQLRVPDDEPLF